MSRNPKWLGFLYPPLSRHQILEQHHVLPTLQDRIEVAPVDRRAPPLIVNAPDLALGFDGAAFHHHRETGCSELNLYTPGRVDSPESVGFHSAFRNPKSAIESRFIVDQRVPPLGEAGPWLHLNDVIQHRSFDPESDLPGRVLERAAPSGARRGVR